MNPLYLRINHASGYSEEKNGNVYLIFNSVDENKEVFEKYAEVWDRIKKNQSKKWWWRKWLRKILHEN